MSVDSETQLTVWKWENFNEKVDAEPVAEDQYKIVNANNTGTALVRLDYLMQSYVQATAEYITMNGSTPVPTAQQYHRCFRMRSIVDGGNGNNLGLITATQATSGDLLCAIPIGYGQSVVAAMTVPVGKDLMVQKVIERLVRDMGSSGSATVTLAVRPYGESWRHLDLEELSDSSSVDDEIQGGRVFHAGTDIVVTVTKVSDNDSSFIAFIRGKWIDV